MPRVLDAGLLVFVIALAAPSIALGVSAFRTPKKAAYWGESEGEGAPHLICWTPNDGFTVSMSERGRANKQYVALNRGYFDPAPGRVLRFGESWRSGVYRCKSARSGLTCSNAAGNGWWLGRFRGYRLF